MIVLFCILTSLVFGSLLAYYILSFRKKVIHKKWINRVGHAFIDPNPPKGISACVIKVIDHYIDNREHDSYRYIWYGSLSSYKMNFIKEDEFNFLWESECEDIMEARFGNFELLE